MVCFEKNPKFELQKKKKSRKTVFFVSQVSFGAIFSANKMRFQNLVVQKLRIEISFRTIPLLSIYSKKWGTRSIFRENANFENSR